ncbi:hypothetical protein Tery_0139 [Trichodesmium erythraeum IMS101]|uniref:Uncharacterized protein n=1 Tax=Trichodesmium erythraeum (strain IMS101) TaxID=203124 RepID=Q11A40_TRIEI|nr:hypothetical protein [Trichodesmium erythraeum GBRTRLIN201]MCH2049333.1 hypothetical protein [Trichodesmium sp. ALOHA_ZT_67]MDE5093429.1 hypothetical protein [Trichodesmium sp. St11_bin5]MDT9341482.1 hypothetical protein [Trichodesmium erythraeum 21-75]
MTQDITPWLNEIKALQEKIVELQTKVNVTQDTVSKWLKLYNIEAKQRRNEAQQSQETIDNLKTKLQKLQKGFSFAKDNRDEVMTTIEEQIEDLQTLDQFKAKIIEVSQERDRYLEKLQELTKCLQQEQTSHGNTRRSLTNALADAVDLLAKAKAAKQQKSETTPNIQLKTEINHQNQTSVQLQERFYPDISQLLNNEEPSPRLPEY